MSKQECLVKKYLKYEKAGMPNGNTWEDFYDYAKISPGLRTDFTSAAIIKQVLEVVEAEKKATICLPLK